MVGYECDGCEHVLDYRGRPTPTCADGTPRTFVILGSAPAIWAPGDSWWYEHWDKERVGAATMGSYTTPGGGTVFTAATTDWAHGAHCHARAGSTTFCRVCVLNGGRLPCARGQHRLLSTP